MNLMNLRNHLIVFSLTSMAFAYKAPNNLNSYFPSAGFVQDSRASIINHMKIRHFLAIPVVLLITTSLSPAENPAAQTIADSRTDALFNGTDLNGWDHVLVGDGVKKEDVWSVKEGVLVCKGTPFGYLFTKKSYQDFTLTFQWRWAPGGTPGNSGVLLRIAGKPATFMPKCVEAQLKHENAGDTWGFFGASIDGPAERIQEIKKHEALGDFRGVKKIKAAEKPAGEWNQYEIKVSGETLELKVNGELVNQVKGLDILSGPIGFQSEGAEIHFRDIRLMTHQP